MADHPTVLYICQNPTGIEVIELLAKQFPEINFYCVSCENLFNQPLLMPCLKNITSISIPIAGSEDGFYDLSALSRMKRIRHAYAEFQTMELPKIDLVIYNNDGAFQRMVSGRFDCPKVMLLDGVLSGNEHALNGSALKIKILTAAYAFFPKRFNFILPSVLGISGPDTILAVTRSCRAYLRKNRVSSDRIRVIGFPRLNRMRQVDSNSVSNKAEKVVFVAQSFLWHGLHQFNSAMSSEIEFWKNLCCEIGVDFTVKPHPRNSTNDFQDIEDITFLSSQSHDFDPCTVFVGMSSTYILECHKLGYGVLITRSCAFFQSVDNMFFSPEFPVVENRDQAEHFLNNLNLCTIDKFEENFMFGPDALFEEFGSLL